MKLCLSLLLSWSCHFCRYFPHPTKRANGSDGGEDRSKQGCGLPSKISLLPSDWLSVWQLCPPYPREKVLIGQYRGDWQLAGCGIKITFPLCSHVYKFVYRFDFIQTLRKIPVREVFENSLVIAVLVKVELETKRKIFASPIDDYAKLSDFSSGKNNENPWKAKTHYLLIFWWQTLITTTQSETFVPVLNCKWVLVVLHVFQLLS